LPLGAAAAEAFLALLPSHQSDPASHKESAHRLALPLQQAIFASASHPTVAMAEPAGSVLAFVLRFDAGRLEPPSGVGALV